MKREGIMPKILIVDDQPHLQQLFSQELMDEGYTVVSVDDAEKAEGYVEHSHPDLVLLDLYLKGFQGWELLHAIKQKNSHLPVLIVTAYDSFAEDPRLSEAEGYWVKSFVAFDELKQKIAHLLGGKTVVHESNY
jgi:two-component system response regulator (stage 0 sporulation protein F)